MQTNNSLACDLHVLSIDPRYDEAFARNNVAKVARVRPGEGACT